MSGREVNSIHTRLLKLALIPEESKSYWEKHEPDKVPSESQQAYDEYWFGSINKNTVSIVLTNLRARFDAFPHCLEVLKKWSDISLNERTLICHWHLQLSDPMYRLFTSDFLQERFLFPPPVVNRNDVIRWVDSIGDGRWAYSTQVQFSRKLLYCASTAGLITGKKDPRSLQYPQISNRCLSYLLYLLREIEFEGTLLKNPYLVSVGLRGSLLEAQIRHCNTFSVQRMGEMTEFNWNFPDLQAWAESEWPEEEKECYG